MKARAPELFRVVWATICILIFTAPATAAEKFGIFETIHHSSLSFEETAAAVESELRGSGLTLHAVHEVLVPDNIQQAKIYILTSPEYMAAAKNESPRTISAQVLRVGVFTIGEDLQTYVNMSSPRAHAMVFYTNSDQYDGLLIAADLAAQAIRDAVSAVPGESLSLPQKPMRTEKHLRKYKGDGPARMMTKFRTYQKSQLQISQATAAQYGDTVANTSAKLIAGEAGDASEESRWQLIAQIPIGDDGVYFGLSNPFVEDKMLRINSRFRDDNKSDNAPYPGVDHMTALPVDVLVIKEADETLVLHYGQMWRMQLYFWDSGYRAFTANMGVPGEIANSIEAELTETSPQE